MIKTRMFRFLVFAVLWQLLGLLFIAAAFVYAHDDGRYTNSPLKPWFDQLKSGNGLCCSVADGEMLDEPYWQPNDDPAFPYRVRIDGQWINVPREAVVSEPNRAGRAMVWPLRGLDGMTIRCFMPGSLG